MLIIRRIKEIIHNQEGVTIIEFALVLPILILFFIGMFEISNYVFAYNMMNRTAAQIVNITARDDLTRSELQGLLVSADRIAEPFNFEANGKVIVTSIARVSDDPNVPPQAVWQASHGNGPGVSRIDPGSLPEGLTVSQEETLIFVEVFYKFQPLLLDFLISEPLTNIYTMMFGKPRVGTMQELPDT